MAATELRANWKKASAFGIVDDDVANALQRTLLRHDLAGKRERAVEQRAGDDFVEQRGAGKLARRHRRTRHDHVERSLDAGDARQALRATRPGQQAELDLGQCDLRIGRRDPEVTAERELEAAAHADASDRRDHRLPAFFRDPDERRQRRLSR